MSDRHWTDRALSASTAAAALYWAGHLIAWWVR